MLAVPEPASEDTISVMSYILWAVVILACFWLGARLSLQTREKKKSELRLNFDAAKTREEKKRR